MNQPETVKVLNEIGEERKRQTAKWGVQHRPEMRNIHPLHARDSAAIQARKVCDEAEKRGPLPGYTGGASWEHIMDEEYAEALAEYHDKAKRRAELIQCAAVLVAWIEDLDTH